MTISSELLDELLKGCQRPGHLLGEAGPMKALKVGVMAPMPKAELTARPGHEAGARLPPEQTNRRDGTATTRVEGADGEVPLAVPRDRDGSFGPGLVRKGQARTRGFGDKIIGMPGQPQQACGADQGIPGHCQGRAGHHSGPMDQAEHAPRIRR